MLQLLFVSVSDTTFVETDLIMKYRLIYFLFLTLSFTTLYAQDNYFPPYYSARNGTADYAVWRLVYPDALLRTDTSGEAVCTIRIDTLGHVSGKEISASHPLFVKAAEDVIDSMKNWQPARKDGKNVDTTIVIRIPFNPDAYRERIWRQRQILDECRGQVVDTKPVFPDRIRSLVMGNMSWPDEKVKNAVAVCRFTVSAKGNIENAQVIEGTDSTFNNEALRILANFPRLIPARKNGKNVSFDYFLTMRFWKDDLEHYIRSRETARKDLETNLSELYTYSVYPGGASALAQFVSSHLEITPEMKATGKQGRVIYSFDVDIDGAMKNFKLVRGLHPLMDAEALRVLQLVDKKWSTGYYFNPKKWYREFYVNQYSMPVIFKW